MNNSLAATTGLTQFGNVQLDGGSRLCLGGTGACDQTYVERSGANTVNIDADTALTTSGAIQSGSGYFAAPSTVSAYLQGKASNGATAIGVKIGNANTLSTEGALPLAIYANDAVDAVATVNRLGQYTVLGAPPRSHGVYKIATTADSVFATAGVNAIGLPASPTVVNGGGTCTPAIDTSDSARPMVQLATSATTGRSCGYAGPFTTVRMGWRPLMSGRAKTCFSSNNLTRIYIGMVQSSLDQVASLAAANTIQNCVFRYDTGIGDSTWVAESSDGTTASETSTGVTVSHNTWYSLMIDASVTGACDFYVNGVLKVHKTNNIPNSTQALGLQASQTTLGNFTRALCIDGITLERD